MGSNTPRFPANLEKGIIIVIRKTITMNHKTRKFLFLSENLLKSRKKQLSINMMANGKENTISLVNIPKKAVTRDANNNRKVPTLF